MKTSRRDFFRFISTLGLVSFVTTPLSAKTAKNIVKYQSTPKDGNCVRHVCTLSLKPMNVKQWKEVLIPMAGVSFTSKIQTIKK